MPPHKMVGVDFRCCSMKCVEEIRLKSARSTVGLNTEIPLFEESK